MFINQQCVIQFHLFIKYDPVPSFSLVTCSSFVCRCQKKVEPRAMWVCLCFYSIPHTSSPGRVASAGREGSTYMRSGQLLIFSFFGAVAGSQHCELCPLSPGWVGGCRAVCLESNPQVILNHHIPINGLISL